MATVIEIAEKLRNGEEVIIHKKHQFIVMRQMSDHDIGDIRVNFKPHGKNYVKLTLP